MAEHTCKCLGHRLRVLGDVLPVHEALVPAPIRCKRGERAVDPDFGVRNHGGRVGAAKQRFTPGSTVGIYYRNKQH